MKLTNYGRKEWLRATVCAALLLVLCVVLAVIVNLSGSCIYYVAGAAAVPLWLMMLPLSVLVIYFNIVLAQCYAFFFLEIEPAR